MVIVAVAELAVSALFPAYIRFKRRGEILIFAILCFGGIFASLARDRI